MSDPTADFVQEGEEQITTLNNALLDLEQSPDDDEAMDEIFRTAHTLKGNCGAMGLTRASDLAHAIEDLLDGVKSGDIEVTGEVMDAIFDGVDDLEAMIEEFGSEGDVSTDPTETIESLRSQLSGASGPADIEEPTDEEVEAILSGFEPPSEADHNGYLVRLAINESPDINNGILVVNALVDAFDLIGTDPSREAIENEEYEGAFDAVFGTAVGEGAIASALEPVDEVADFKIVEVTGAFPEPTIDDPFDEFTNPDISSEEANEMEVDDLLNEFNELDDIDELAEDVQDDELSEFDEMGDAGSFDDLLEEDEEPEPVEEAPEPTTDEVDDEEVTGDANSVFNELQDEVEMVGFDELQDEIDELEFEEFSDEEEVTMEELLGDDVDLEDDTFLEAEPQPAEEAEPLEPEAEAEPEPAEAEVEPEPAEAEAEPEPAEAEAEPEPAEAEAEPEPDEAEAEPEPAEAEAEPEPTEAEAEPEPAEAEAEPEPAEAEAEPEPAEAEAEPEPAEAEAEPEPAEAEAEPEPAEAEAEPEPAEAEAEPEPAEAAAEQRDLETIVAEESPADATAIVDEQYTLDDLRRGPADEYDVDDRWDLNKDGLVEAVVEAVADDLEPPEPEPAPADERALETIVEEESAADASEIIADRYTLDDLRQGPADEYDVSDRWDRNKGELIEAVVEAVADDLEPPEPEPEPADERALETIVKEETAEEAATLIDDRFTLDELQSGPAETYEISGRWDLTKDELVEALVDAVAESMAADDVDPLDDAADDEAFAADDIEADADAFEADAADFDAGADFEADADDFEADVSFDEADASLDEGFSADMDEMEADSLEDEAFDDGLEEDELDLDQEFDDVFEEIEVEESTAFEGPEADFESGSTDPDEFGADSVDTGESDPERIVLDQPEMPIPDSLSVPEPSESELEGGEGRGETQSIRVDVDQIDGLLTLVEGMVTSRVRLRHAIDSGEDLQTISRELDDLEDITSELQTEVMDIRLVPLETVVSRLPRVVRDIARDQDKQVAFELEGADVELDRSIIDRIGDPLIHLVRNAVDHGIETPAEREDAGKPEEGTVKLSAERARGRVRIEVDDDGRGIDPQDIIDAAIDEDVITEAAAEDLTDEEAYDLMFHPGLSTTEEVTDVSGRGVGMDVVKQTIEDFDGTISVESEPGEGSTITMQVPVTVAIDEVLFVESGEEEFGLPTKAVQDIGDAGSLEQINGRTVLIDNGQEVPVVDLSGELETDGLPVNGTGMLVRIRDDVRPVAIHCDHVGSQQEVVVKQFEGFLGDVPGLSGATVRGRGEVVNIIDVTSL